MSASFLEEKRDRNLIKLEWSGAVSRVESSIFVKS
jgi:hypothetical protein